LRCPECGHENPVLNNFCGICGAAMQRTPGKPAAPAQAPQTPSAPLRQPPQRVVERPSSTTISGPSILGLGSEPPPRNVEYLLHDEDDSHAGRRWFLRIVGILLIGGLGWWAWQSGNLSAFVTWFKGGRSQPAQVADNDARAPESTPAPAPAQPSASGTPTAPPAADSTNKPADTKGAAPAEHPTAASDEAKDEEDDSPSDSGPVTEKPAPMVATAPPAKPKKEDVKPAEAHVKKTSAPKPAVSAKAPPKPDAAATSSADDRQVATAERYLYGKGVATNCDRAMGILRPAAEEGNAKARTQLGALYSTGHCVARDLPNAYRWFALALRVDHDNSTVEQNLQMIWRQMSPAERQLAIKLTQ
jgi:hypothetical protein